MAVEIAARIIVRVPNELPASEVNREVIRALADLEDEETAGLPVIVEVARTRIRRPTSNDDR
jgi:hypothetical protein